MTSFFALNSVTCTVHGLYNLNTEKEEIANKNSLDDCDSGVVM